MRAAPQPHADKRRPRDPDRRRKIAEAAAEVLEQGGVFALNHRAVARQAAVPLGSTTYYFKDLDALLGAALEIMSDEELRVLDAWGSKWDLETQLEDALVALVLAYTNDDRIRSTLEYEVHMLAYRRPSMKQLGDRWQEDFGSRLRAVLPESEVRVVIASFDAIMLYGLGLDVPLTDAWARDYLRRVLRTSRNP